MWWVRSAASSAPERPWRAATKIVLSPAIVPATSGSVAWSIASASAFAKPEGVRTTTRPFVGVSSSAHRRSAEVSSSSRSMSSAPGSA
jgi:hypothetical protein